MASRVQGGAAARPWWHNPDLDMAVEDIATFYREHTQKLSRLQKQKEKEKKKEIKKKQRKQRKRERGESTSSDSSSGSSSGDGSEDYDSDMEPDGLDLTKNLMPLDHYPTRREILDNCFKIVRGDVFKKMVPEQFKDMPEGDLVDKLRAQMDGLSRKRINHVLQYGVDMDFSSGESDVDSEEEVEKAKRAAKAEKNKKETKTLADLPDTEDLVVPAIEDLDSMSLEQITELREKIRQKVEKAQEEEKVTEAKKMEQDDDYEYVWAEADPEEEQLKKVDEIVTNIKQEDAPKKKKEESSEEEEEESSDDSESDEEMNEAQLRLRAKALALAKAKVMAARKAKEEA